MALDVVKFLVNKFFRSLADLESDLSGFIPIAIKSSLIPILKEFKDDLKEIDVMPEGCNYSELISELYELNDVVAECRVVAECKEPNNMDVLCINIFKTDFVKKTKPRVEELKTKLKELISSILSSQVVGGDDQSTLGMSASLQEVSNPPEMKGVLGFEEEAKKIKDLLLGGTATTFRAIGVVGVAGVGKTTLVQKMLEMERVKKFFSPILWIPFSSTREGVQQYSRFSFETCIVDKKGNLPDEKIVGLNKISERLNQLLSGKRYLIVLDDVCHQQINIEERLCSELPKDTGGAVIVTSRLKQATRKLVELKNLVFVKPLDKATCWRIFEQTHRKSSSLSSLLTPTKVEIMDQFHGLPSIAKALAEILSEPPSTVVHL